MRSLWVIGFVWLGFFASSAQGGGRLPSLELPHWIKDRTQRHAVEKFIAFTVQGKPYHLTQISEETIETRFGELAAQVTLQFQEGPSCKSRKSVTSCGWLATDRMLCASEITNCKGRVIDRDIEVIHR